MLQRPQDNKIIAGVCAGLAKEYDLDPLLLRLLFVFAFIMFGAGPLLYLMLWILMPKA